MRLPGVKFYRHPYPAAALDAAAAIFLRLSFSEHEAVSFHSRLRFRARRAFLPRRGRSIHSASIRKLNFR
jgi:hypothetical protein